MNSRFAIPVAVIIAGVAAKGKLNKKKHKTMLWTQLWLEKR